jgi:hypothetical protein
VRISPDRQARKATCADDAVTRAGAGRS